MSFSIKAVPNAVPGFNTGILLQGNYVTSAVHRVIQNIMSETDIRTEAYRIRTKVGAFFQSGSDNPEGKRIFIEFMNANNPGDMEDFCDLLTREVRPYIGSDITKISVSANTEGVYYYFIEIAKETACRYESGDSCTPLAFCPEDNLQWNRVFRLCKDMGLNIFNH